MSPHYLIKTAHFETTVADRFLQCVRLNRLFATFTENCLMFIFLIFWKPFYKIYVSLLAENLSHFHRFWSRICLQNSICLMLRSNFMKQILWRAVWRIYNVIKELNKYIVEYPFLFLLLQKVLKSTKKRRSYNRKHKWVFFLNTVYMLLR